MSKQKVLMPQMGESIQEGTITQWHKKIGDSVQQDELLLEISTDKVDTEVPAPFSGKVVEILAKEGDTVKVNAAIAVIDTDAKGAAPDKKEKESSKEEKTTKTASDKSKKEEKSKKEAEKSKEESEEFKEKSRESKEKQKEETRKKSVQDSEEFSEEAISEGRVVASPLARKIAKEHSLNLQKIKGTGSGNKIVKDDVLSAIQDESTQQEQGIQRPASPLVSAAMNADDENLERLSDGTRIKRVRMSPMRKKIAEHMVMSKQTSPHVTSVIEIDVQKIVDIREKNKSKFESQYGFKLTFMPFFMEAALKAIQVVPIVNSSVDGDTIIYKKDVNLGVAVALESGLIVPVIKNAHEKNFIGLGHELQSLAEKARTKKLLPEDVRGGTFSITSFGGFGTVIGQPIINQPQVAIFGIGAMQKKPVVIHDAIAIRTMCYCVLSFDHRVIDGSDSGKFLSAVKNNLENWDTPI